MTPITCGLVRTPRSLVAVVIGADGDARRAIRVPLTDDARYGLVEYLVAIEATAVVAVSLARGDPVARQAVRTGLTVLVAPDATVDAITCAAAIAAPARVAATLARLPRVPLLRAQLRRLASTAVPGQLPLL